jgi:hypothetical protein
LIILLATAAPSPAFSSTTAPTTAPATAPSEIPLPSIPDQTFNVLTYGAIGDGVADDTAHIQAAIDACSAAGGGTVLLPAGKTFVSNPLSVSSNINIQIDANLDCQLRTQYSDPKKSLITYSNAHDVELSGKGIIEGRGGVGPPTGGGGATGGWWGTNKKNTAKVRPRLVRFSGCTRVLVRDITLRNSPSFHIIFGPTATNDVTIRGVKIFSPSSEISQVPRGSLVSHNTDGIDPLGSNYLIENCDISDGDDNIAMHVEANNITVKNCRMGTGHGISIDATENGVNGVYVSNCTFDGTTNGFHLKAGRDKGGLAQNISFCDITMHGVRHPIYINSYYMNNGDNLPSDPAKDNGQDVTATTPIWQDITMRNLTAGSPPADGVAGIIWGLPEMPIRNVSLINVKIAAPTGLVVNHARNVSFDADTRIVVGRGHAVLATSALILSTPYDATILPGGFANQDVGEPKIPAGISSSLYDPDTGTWTIQGDGAGLGGNRDQFNYSYQSVSGDKTMTAHLSSLAGGGAAGLMFRAGTKADDPFAAVVQSSGGQLTFQWRPAAGAAVSTAPPISAAPVQSVYLKLSRAGDSFEGSCSSDGRHWKPIGPAEEIPVLNSGDLTAGLAVTSNSDGRTAPAVFDHVAISP